MSTYSRVPHNSAPATELLHHQRSVTLLELDTKRLRITVFTTFVGLSGEGGQGAGTGVRVFLETFPNPLLFADSGGQP